MRYMDEYRNPELGQKLLGKIEETLRGFPVKISIMEVCGTHTMSIARAGIGRLLAERVRLLSGPGCPVCVTPNDYMDRAVAWARCKDIIITTFGDMMKVPGSTSSLYREKVSGAQIAIVYSPLEAIGIAEAYPSKKIIFLAIGFETTAPTIAATIKCAREKNLKNFFIHCGHKLVPPAMRTLVNDPELQIDGFICPGHVSTIIGSRPYEFIAREYHIPCVVAGFEPLDILESVWMIVNQISRGNHAIVEIQYTRAVKPEGNPNALSLMNEVFAPVDSIWRGLGTIPESGMTIRESNADFDAVKKIPVAVEETKEHPACICGMILRGVRLPVDCPLFRTTCNPENPIGPCMVSSEGTCAAYYKYEKG